MPWSTSTPGVPTVNDSLARVVADAPRLSAFADLPLEQPHWSGGGSEASPPERPGLRELTEKALQAVRRLYVDGIASHPEKPVGGVFGPNRLVSETTGRSRWEGPTASATQP